jgi:TonB family protein
MCLEAQRVSRVSEDAFGSLGSCLVEGDPQSERRARRIKQRAVVISIVLQSLALVALVLFPLLSKGKRITFERTPLPPYPRLGSHKTHPIDPHTSVTRLACRFCAPSSPDHPIVTQDPTRNTNDQEDGAPVIDIPGDPGGIREGNLFAPPNPGPDPVIGKRTREGREKRRISVGHIEPALLLQRVDPVYPQLGITLRRETRIELHAIISTDGGVESLEILSGDPLFYRSALDAVRQWRYLPTILNGNPVEVDTHITVIYTLSH